MTMTETPPIVDVKIMFVCSQIFRGHLCNRRTGVVIPVRLMKEGIEVTCPRCEKTTVLD